MERLRIPAAIANKRAKVDRLRALLESAERELFAAEGRMLASMKAPKRRRAA